MKRPARLFVWVTFALFAVALVSFVAVRLSYPYKYSAEIAAAAADYGLSPALVCGVIRTESGFDPDSVSPAGAVGLMQLMPATALYTAEREGMEDFNFSRLFEPETNIRLGCAYLKYLTEKFGGNLDLALAAYNAGEGTVRSWLNNKEYSADGRSLRMIPYKETRGYADKARGAAKVYKGFYGLS
ncbi:MAG: lytic transglycosylase domain-containing protein [Clostridiales bacterium]|jgi:soluble lytic murein transglycosylase|nr:lytic transglycosylase domain-containing protein [Clostridiales bacterium]